MPISSRCTLRRAASTRAATAAIVASFGLASTATAEELKPGEALAGRPGTVVLENLIGVSAGTYRSLSGIGIGALGGNAVQAGPISFSHTSQTLGTAETKTTSIAVSPAFDVFLSRRITIGGNLAFAYQWQSSAVDGLVPLDGYDLSIAPRVGYFLPISEQFSLWTRVGASFGASHFASPAPVSASTRVRGSAFVTLDVVLPLTKNLLFLAGPRAEASMTESEVFGRATATAFDVGVRGSLSLAF